MMVDDDRWRVDGTARARVIQVGYDFRPENASSFS
jgi:hypothetical protein